MRLLSGFRQSDPAPWQSGLPGTPRDRLARAVWWPPAAEQPACAAESPGSREARGLEAALAASRLAPTRSSSLTSYISGQPRAAGPGLSEGATPSGSSLPSANSTCWRRLCARCRRRAAGPGPAGVRAAAGGRAAAQGQRRAGQHQQLARGAPAAPCAAASSCRTHRQACSAAGLGPVHCRLTAAPAQRAKLDVLAALPSSPASLACEQQRLDAQQAACASATQAAARGRTAAAPAALSSSTPVGAAWQAAAAEAAGHLWRRRPCQGAAGVPEQRSASSGAARRQTKCRPCPDGPTAQRPGSGAHLWSRLRGLRAQPLGSGGDGGGPGQAVPCALPEVRRLQPAAGPRHLQPGTCSPLQGPCLHCQLLCRSPVPAAPFVSLPAHPLSADASARLTRSSARVTS